MAFSTPNSGWNDMIEEHIQQNRSASRKQMPWLIAICTWCLFFAFPTIFPLVAFWLDFIAADHQVHITSTNEYLRIIEAKGQPKPGGKLSLVIESDTSKLSRAKIVPGSWSGRVVAWANCEARKGPAHVQERIANWPAYIDKGWVEDLKLHADDPLDFSLQVMIPEEQDIWQKTILIFADISVTYPRSVGLGRARRLRHYKMFWDIAYQGPFKVETDSFSHTAVFEFRLPAADDYRRADRQLRRRLLWNAVGITLFNGLLVGGGLGALFIYRAVNLKRPNAP